MKRSEIKLLILEIISILFLLFSIFVKNILNEYLINIILLLLFIITYFMVGFERSRHPEKKKITFLICFYTISLIIIEYTIGLINGYSKTPYSLNIVNIFKNIFPILIYIILSELLRYNIGVKGKKKKIIIVLLVIMLTLFDTAFTTRLYDTLSVGGVLEVLIGSIITGIFKNSMLTYFTINYGYESCISYNIITSIYIYLVPIIPKIDNYISVILEIIYPIFLGLVINYQFTRKKKDTRKSPISTIISIILIIFIIVVISLNSNLFRYWIAVVGSGSMEPTINKGDAVLIDKSYKKNLDKLAKGDILVFKINDTIYMHRIVSIKNISGNYSIKTKGDRKGQAEDVWTVTNKDVIGKVKFKISNLGKPTVWLNEKSEER